MAVKKFGYVRVSTREQNPERQIHILRDEEGIDERDIYVEKESGRQFERPVYRSLVDNILREGDLLVVTELKRFGRNYGEIYKEWFHITKEIGADIKVTSMPILDTTQSKELVGQLITDVVLAVFAYVADEDWTERHELQRQGIEVAKADGKHSRTRKTVRLCWGCSPNRLHQSAAPCYTTTIAQGLTKCSCRPTKGGQKSLRPLTICKKSIKPTLCRLLSQCSRMPNLTNLSIFTPRHHRPKETK